MGERRRHPARRAFWLVCLALLVTLVAAPLAHAARDASSGTLRWSWSYPSTESQDSMSDVVAAPGGSAYAVGKTPGLSRGTRMVIVRFGATGATPVWTRFWQGEAGGADYPVAAAVDRAGSVIAAGMTKTTTQAQDWVVLKYSPAGELKWEATLGGASPQDDWLNDVTVDRRGDVYACGGLLDASGNLCYAVARFRGSDGKLLWTHIEPGLNASWHDDHAKALALDEDGNVYATGVSFDASASDRRWLTMKLTPAGKVAWRQAIAAKGFNRYGGGVRVAGGRVYVAGYGDTSEETMPLMVARYSTTGRRAWLRPQVLKGAKQQYMTGFAANATGVVVTAIAMDTDAAVVVKVTPRGRRAWSHVYAQSSTRLSRWFHAVCMDGQGRVWVAGAARPAGSAEGDSDLFVQRFSAGGASLWARTADGGQHAGDGFSAAALSGASTLFCAGRAGAPDNSSWAEVAKYRR